MIQQKLKQIREGKLSAQENIKNFINKINKENKDLNIVLHINENAINEAKKIDEKIKKGDAGKLAGLGVLIKSNINVKDMIVNCGSKTLENYKSGYDASVIEKLKKQDAIILGMTNMDEFASGSSGETSAFGVCKNPVVIDRVPGGSSSGSCASVAADFCDFSLGSDTGGSIRNPASHCGVVGFKPSYGAVSRYGLIDLSMSLDQIGPVTKNIEDSKIIFNIIKGIDNKDSTTREVINNQLKIDKVTIGIPNISCDNDILDLVNKKIKEVCKKNNWNKKNIEIKHIDLGIQTYYPINYVEFYSGTRRFDGRKYGKKIEDSCGEEVLRRILGGKEISQAEYAGKYYRKALIAKKILEKEFEDAFKKCDAIAMPTVPKLPHKIGDEISIEDMYNYDVLTVLANIAEIPAISVPIGKINNIPTGIQILGKKLSDNKLLEIAKFFED